jgi:hypothetical protein
MTVDELRQELDEEARTTRRVLERIPEDRLAWKPHPRSMSMGQLAMHVASLSGEIAKISTQASFDVDTPRGTPCWPSRWGGAWGGTWPWRPRSVPGCRPPCWPAAPAAARGG